MPVDRSTLDRAPKRPVKLGPPAPPPRPPPKKLGPPAPPRIVAGGGGNFPPPYKPTVAAHDLPPTRDARQAPYAYVLGHPGERSNIPPAQQVALAKSTQGGKVTPAGTIGGHLTKPQSNALAKHLLSIPHPVEQLRQIGAAKEAGVLPASVIPATLGAASKILEPLKGASLSSLPKISNTLESFPQLDSVTPAQRAKLDEVVAKQGRSVPANATLSDYYQAIYGPKPDGWRGLYRNLPRDVFMTPLYTAQGGYALGDAVVRALPKATPILNAKGDTTDLREIGAQQLDILKHPGKFAQQHPGQAALMLIGGAKLAGRGAAVGRTALGRGALEATPRSVPLIDPETGAPLPAVGGEVPSLQRGVLSTRNLTTRKAQQLQDALVGHSPRLQKREITKTLLDARAESRAQVTRDAAPAIKEFLEARKGVTRKQAERINENEARGITPQQHAAYRGAEAPSVPEQMTPAEARYQASIVGLDAAQRARAGSLGLLGEFAATRRAHLPAIKVAAQAGDDAAQHFLELDQEVPQLRSALESIDERKAPRLERQIAKLRQQRDAAHGSQVASIESRLARLERVRQGLEQAQEMPDARTAPTHEVEVPPVEPFGGVVGTLEQHLQDAYARAHAGAYQRAVANLAGKYGQLGVLRSHLAGSQREASAAARSIESRLKGAPSEPGALGLVRSDSPEVLLPPIAALRALAAAKEPFSWPSAREAVAEHLAPELEQRVAAAAAADPAVQEIQHRLLAARAAHIVTAEPGYVDKIRGEEPPPGLSGRQRAVVDYRARSTGAQIKALQERRANLLRTQTPFADITSAPIRKLEERLAKTRTKGEVAGALEQSLAERETALSRFTQQHAASGAPEPAYVPELLAKRVPSPFSNTSSGAGLAAAKRRYRPGATYQARLFEEGAHQPITDRLILQHHAIPGRVEQAFRFMHEVSNPERGVVKHVSIPEGGARYEIPNGYVAQVERPHTSPLADELGATTGSTAPTDPLHSLTSTFDRDKTHVEPGETVRLWPTSFYEGLADMKSLNPPTGKGALAARAAGRALRNSLLYSRPGYVVTNTVSNILQNAVIAGTGPSSYAHALARNEIPVSARVDDTGAAAVNFDALGSSSLRNAWADRGSTAGGVARVALHPAARYTQAIFHASVAMENWTRRAAYLSKALPDAIKQAHPEYNAIQRFAASWKPADTAVKQVLDDMANGRTPEARASAQRAVKVLNQALGDFAAMGEHRGLSVAVPFWRWTNFVRQLMTETLPFHYPGRALLLYRLGSLGQEAQHQLGPLTQSLQGSIPGLGGAFSTQRINPIATIGQNLLPTQGQTAIDPERSISNFSPFGAIAYSILAHKDPVTGTELTNQYGLPVHGSDYLRVAGNQIWNLNPLSRTVAPLFGGGKTSAPDTSINFPGLVQTGPPRKGPQQPNQSIETTLANLFSPVPYRRVDLRQMALSGDKKLRTQLKSSFLAHARSDVDKIALRLAKERGVDMTKPSQARTRVRIDAATEWRKEQKAG